MSDGGAAFPFRHESHNDRKGYSEVESSEGMSLRDYFAAHAVSGLLASQGYPRILGWEPLTTAAYEIADAMLLKAMEP